MNDAVVDKHVAVIGNGLVGNLAAAYLKQMLPKIRVTVVGRENPKRPIVGESTIEVSARFFHALGLGRHLEEKQFHKYGLTYYFPIDSAAREYVVHESPGVIRLPSYQLNRNLFDSTLREFNREIGVQFIDANASAYRCGAQHTLELRNDTDLTADWVVDASGRNRFLTRKLGLSKPSPNQRSCFWFRIADFDRSVLTNIRASKRVHHCYDSYFVTHHFYAKGFWVWLIPLKSEDGRELMSIGVTYRPDMVCDNIRSLDKFVEIVGAEHPVLEELVASGNVLDTNFYGNYMYEASKYYSSDGWFLIGDAAFPSDPANSAGLSTVCHQIPQVASMIEKSRQSVLTERYVSALQRHLESQLALQDEWTRWYEIMDKPVRIAWTLLLANAAYFHVVLPSFICGAFLDGRYCEQFSRRLDRSRKGRGPEPFPRLLTILEENEGALAESIPNLYPRAINWDLYVANNSQRKIYASRYFRTLASFRFRLIRIVGFHPMAFAQLPVCLKDFLVSIAVRIAPGSLFGSPSTDDMGSPWAANGAHLDLQRLNKSITTENQSPISESPNTKVNNACIHRAMDDHAKV